MHVLTSNKSVWKPNKHEGRLSRTRAPLLLAKIKAKPEMAIIMGLRHRPWWLRVKLSCCCKLRKIYILSENFINSRLLPVLVVHQNIVANLVAPAVATVIDLMVANPVTNPVAPAVAPVVVPVSWFLVRLSWLLFIIPVSLVELVNSDQTLILSQLSQVDQV